MAYGIISVATTECRATFPGLSLKWLCGSLVKENNLKSYLERVNVRVYGNEEGIYFSGSTVDLELIERGGYIIEWLDGTACSI